MQPSVYRHTQDMSRQGVQTPDVLPFFFFKMPRILGYNLHNIIGSRSHDGFCKISYYDIFVIKSSLFYSSL